MSQEQLIALLAKLKEDTSLRSKLQKADNTEAAIMLAREAGIDASYDDLMSAVQLANQLSDDEPEKMSGGIDTFGNPKNPGNSVKYACDWTLKGWRERMSEGGQWHGVNC